MPELTSFIDGGAPKRELAPLRVRVVEHGQSWVVEERERAIGHLNANHPSLGESYIFAAFGERWEIKRGFFGGSYRITSVRNPNEKGEIQSWRTPIPHRIPERPGVLSFGGRIITCREHGVRLEVTDDEALLYRIERAWQDSSLEAGVWYHLWPEPGYVVSEDPLPSVMPLFWLGLTIFSRDIPHLT